MLQYIILQSVLFLDLVSLVALAYIPGVVRPTAAKWSAECIWVERVPEYIIVLIYSCG